MDDSIVVGIADYKLARGKQKLLTRDLGSCIAIALKDPKCEVGGLLHIMLPEAPKNVEKTQLPKYADSGIELMVFKLRVMGADPKRLVAKIAGGAHIIHTQGVPESEDVSSRNLRAVRKKLTEMSIPVLSCEVGDNFPRTVIFEPESGVMQIKTVGKQDRFI